MVTSHINLGYWKRSLNQAFMIHGLDKPYQGYLREVRRGQYLVFAIPLPNREDWQFIVNRHKTNLQFERI